MLAVILKEILHDASVEPTLTLTVPPVIVAAISQAIPATVPGTDKPLA